VAYDEAIVGLYAHLDRAEELLSTQRYLAGSEVL
jgi:glutathionyl-hydroquinone reductase